jgi:uncharacterized repeat protein (TIGR03806 family)
MQIEEAVNHQCHASMKRPKLKHPLPASRVARLKLLTASVIVALSGCGGGDGPGASSSGPAATQPTPTLPAPSMPTSTTNAPAKLSGWNQFTSDGSVLALREGVVPFALNTPLFSDYTHKLRTLWLPPGTQITYAAQGPLPFPVGAVVTKTFYYPRAAGVRSDAVGALSVAQIDGGESVDLKTHRLIETRIMVRESSGRWSATTYVWDDDQRDATLVRTGKAIAVDLVSTSGTTTQFTYAVPSDTQCISCHAVDATTGAFEAIGPQAPNMNRDYAYASGTRNQLDALTARGLLTGLVQPAPRWAVWDDPATGSLEARTRTYFEVNCSTCHNPTGRASRTGLWLGLTQTERVRLGICKPPAGGQLNGRFTYDVQPGSAAQSFLFFRVSNYRLNSDPQRVAMPELGRHVFHAEGNALVRDWIDTLAEACGG